MSMKPHCCKEEMKWPCGGGAATAQLLLSRPPPYPIPTMPSNSSRGLYPHSAAPMSVNQGDEKEVLKYNQKTVIQAAQVKSQ